MPTIAAAIVLSVAITGCTLVEPAPDPASDSVLEIPLTRERARELHDTYAALADELAIRSAELRAYAEDLERTMLDGDQQPELRQEAHQP